MFKRRAAELAASSGPVTKFVSATCPACGGWFDHEFEIVNDSEHELRVKISGPHGMPVLVGCQNAGCTHREMWEVSISAELTRYRLAPMENGD